MLEGYWRRRGGVLYREVAIGGPGGKGEWPDGCTVRRIDGVLIDSGLSRLDRFSRRTAEFFDCEIRAGASELIEVKPALNRTAIGQAIAARHMFQRQYGVAPGRVVVLCESSDSALEWVCLQENVDVERIGSGSLASADVG